MPRNRGSRRKGPTAPLQHILAAARSSNFEPKPVKCCVCGDEIPKPTYDSRSYQLVAGHRFYRCATDLPQKHMTATEWAHELELRRREDNRFGRIKKPIKAQAEAYMALVAKRTPEPKTLLDNLAA